MSRLFVALWPPPAVVEALAALARPAEPGVRWVRPEHWHVTLRFLGDADPRSATPTRDRRRRLCRPSPARVSSRRWWAPV